MAVWMPVSPAALTMFPIVGLPLGDPAAAIYEPLPWVRFDGVARVIPKALWWIVDSQGITHVFVGETANWRGDLMVRRGNGNMIRATPGSCYAVITPPALPVAPAEPPAIDIPSVTPYLEP
jgi:hypothetical protein